MESNKNKFENLKLLLGDFFDTLNESNSGLLQQVEDFKKEIVALNEKIEGYKEGMENLQERLSYLEISDALRERNKIMADTLAAQDDPYEQTGEDIADETSATESNPEDDEPPFILGGDDDFEETPVNHEIPDTFDVLPDTKSQMAPIATAPAFKPVTPISEPAAPVSSATAPASPVASQPLDLWQSPAKEEPQQESKLIMDAVRPDWYDWEVDYPAPYLEDIATGIGFNDRLLFLKELFNGNETEFAGAVKAMNQMEHFQQATDYIRRHYPLWDEQSDVVYRFYMNVRRKLRK
ncbi:MAG: hypothetical protein RR555_03635 [Bacteroidales bacterium]